MNLLEEYPDGTKLYHLEPKKDRRVRMALVNWTKTTEECKGFESLWTRFKNWENPRARIHVLLNNRKVVGINAFVCNSRNPYVNCYYFEIDPSVRRRGLGKKLFFSCIASGKIMSCSRLTLRTKEKSLGVHFYKAIGMIPRYLDKGSKELLFDLSIHKVTKIEDILEYSIELHDLPAFSRLRIYRKYEPLL